MTNICFACTKEKEMTIEHIIPQAIGGKLKEYLYCKECNSKFGQSIDKEILRIFGHLATDLDIKRERGKNRPYEISIAKADREKKFPNDDKKTKFIFDGKEIRRKSNLVQNDKINDGVLVQATSGKELKKICRGLEKKRNIEFKDITEKHPGPTNIEGCITTENLLTRRGISKIVYSFLCYKLRNEALSDSFNNIRDYIQGDNKENLARANFVNTLFMPDSLRPLHRIHISFNKKEKLVIGYVMLFGIFRYTILLSRNFKSYIESSGFDYAFDPVKSQQVLVGIFPPAQILTINEILNPKQSEQFMRSELEKGYEVLCRHSKVVEKVFINDLITP